MTQASDDTPDRPFLRRMLRVLALICIGVGVLHCSSFLAQVAQYGGTPPLGTSGWFSQRAQRALYALYFANSTLLLVSGIALLRWKSWARLTLLFWASAIIILSVASTLSWFIPYAIEMTRQRTGPTTNASVLVTGSVAYMGWSVLTGMIADWAFPALVIALMRQPEVRDVWSRPPASAFEVVPMARVNEP